MQNPNNILDPLPPEKPGNSTTSFLIGILHTIIYYASGLGLAALAYAVYGHPYIHAAGLYHWIILLTFTGGLLWLLVALAKYFSGTRTGKLKGIIFTHAISVLSFVFIMYAILHEESDGIAETDYEITVTQAGDTTIFYHGGNILHMRVEDSVILNFIDSERLHQIADSLGIDLREKL